jgi:cobalamin biosynthetic protein CobC
VEKWFMDSRETMPDLADALRYHVGNINAARRLFPNAPEPWIDLSTGINPVPYPIEDFPVAGLARLPEPSELAALEAVAARAYGAAAWSETVAAPGTQAIIQWLPHLVPARRVGILGPTYGEHEKRWRAARAEIVQATSPSQLAGCDVGVIVNPNNPDGRLLSASDLTEIASQCGMLIVDEAFMDVIEPAAGFAPALPDNAIVLRSLGKAYGLAGLRLGFAIATTDLAARLRDALGPWAVSAPAIAIGRKALADSAWLGGAVRRLTSEADRLDGVLTAAGFAIIGGTALFRLAQTGKPDAFAQLARGGILVRPFPWDTGLLRFGIPHILSEWERLEATLCCSSAILHR